MYFLYTSWQLFYLQLSWLKIPKMNDILDGLIDTALQIIANDSIIKQNARLPCDVMVECWTKR